jgi:hypothetical protein
MKRHKHKAIEGYQRGFGGGIAPPVCNAYNKPCPTTGAHITVHCLCGAVGVICPRRKYTFWHKVKG